MAKQGHELLEHGLKDIYDAEHRFVDGLEEMIERCTDDALVDGFRRHLSITKEQIRRLESCFDEIGERPQREECPGAKGLVREFEKFVKNERPDASTLNAFAADAAQKVEHYEIVSYRALVNLADFLGYTNCARAFRQNLAEEEQTAAELRATSEVLSAELTGAPLPGIARRAAGTVLDQVREGAMATMGAAKAVGQTATRRTSDLVDKAERRGRRAVRTARKRGEAARKKTTRSASTARRKTTARKATTTRATNGRRRPTSRSTAGRTTRSAAGRSGTARRPAARTTTRRTSGRKSTTRARARSRR